jgi:hypothetical protein
MTATMRPKSARVDIYVLAAVGGRATESPPPTWQEVRQRASFLTDREFSEAVKRLILSGAITREGRGHTAVLRRNLANWRHGR